MRHFSVEEAREALPEVKRRAERMVKTRAELLAAQPFRERLEKHGRTNGSAPAHDDSDGDPERPAGLRRQLMSEIEALEQLGVLVKDVDPGLVDFPCLHPDTSETVLLCWQVGEDTLAFWHGFHEGFAGRKPLPFT